MASEKQQSLRLDEGTIQHFKRLLLQLTSFYDEISILSKKTPDGPVNKFKLKFLNDTLRKVTALLGQTYRPYPDFEAFDEDQLPTSSDVVLMLSHYMKSMTLFKQTHTFMKSGRAYWHTKGENDVEVN